MNPLAYTALALLFLVVGFSAFVIMMARVGGWPVLPLDAENARRLHRVLGWLFVVLYLVVFVGMLYRVTQYWELWPAHVAIHVTLAFTLFVLLALKVFIPRHAPGLGKYLFGLGAAVFLCSFVLVWITAGHFLIHTTRGMPYVRANTLPENLVDPRMGLDLVITKCSTCHFLRDVMIPRQTWEWESIVNRMVTRAAPRISPDEATQVLSYLTRVFTPQKATGTRDTPVDRYCTPCHSSEFVHKRQYDRATWRNVVLRMSDHGPDIVPYKEVDDIVDYLTRNGPQ